MFLALLGLLITATPLSAHPGGRHARSLDDPLDGCTSPSCLRASTLQGWMQEVFHGISGLYVPKTPGRLFTYGESAFPVVVADAEGLDAIMALAEMELGRVAAFTRKEYLNGFNVSSNEDASIASLHRNLKTWLSRGQCVDDSCICQPIDAKSMRQCINDPTKRIVMWMEGDWPTNNNAITLMNWVQEGGAFVHSFTNLQWDRDFNDKPVTELGFYKVVWKAGIVYSPERSQAKKGSTVPISTDFSDVSRLVSYNVHEIANSITSISSLRGNLIWHTLNDLMYKVQRYFPTDVMQALLAPYLTFAEAQEVSMLWPASAADAKDYTQVSEDDNSMYALYHTLGFAQMWQNKAHGVDVYPGDVKRSTVTAVTKMFGYSSSEQKEYLSTGLYLLPGQLLTVTVLNDVTDTTWRNFSLVIGSEMDDLSKLDQLLRWPNIIREGQLFETSFTVRWMFGGLISILSPKGVGSTLKIELSGAIETPYYDTGDAASAEAWGRRGDMQGLVADLKGKRARFTIPAEGVMGVQADVGQLLDVWDSMVETAYDLYGYPENEWRQQWLSAQIQITIGTMHSGYPIGSYLDKGDPLDRNFVMNGAWEEHWGMAHEIGHNLGDYKWVWSGCTEVVNNLVGMLQYERLVDDSVWPIPKIQDNIDKTLVDYLATNDGGKFNYLKDNPKAKLIVYSQMVRDFGWACQREVFLGYQADEVAQTNLPGSDNDKINQWVERWAHVVGYDLGPLFGEFWSWPLTDETKAAMAQYPPFLPDDIVTQHPDAQYLVSGIVAKYGNRLIRTPPSDPNCTPFDIKKMVSLF